MHEPPPWQVKAAADWQRVQRSVQGTTGGLQLQGCRVQACELSSCGCRVVMVVSLLGDVPKRTQPGKIGELMAWQDAHRRRSLLQTGMGPLTSRLWCCCFCC